MAALCTRKRRSMARAGSEPGDLLEATSREIDDVQAHIDRLSDQAAAAAVDADTVSEIGASHRKLHRKLLEEKQSELLEAQISRPDDETLIHALKSVTAELAAAKITVAVTSDKSTDDAHTRSTSPRTPSQRWGTVRQLDWSILRNADARLELGRVGLLHVHHDVHHRIRRLLSQ